MMRQSSQSSSTISLSGRVRDPPLHITVGILSVTYLDISAILDIDLSAFVLTRADLDTESNPISTVAETDFQLYIAQAWASFQVDKASKDKGKHIRFDGIQVLLHKKSDTQAVMVSKEISLLEIQQSKNIPPASSSSPSPHPTPATASTQPEAHKHTLMSASSSIGSSKSTSSVPSHIHQDNCLLLSS